jgi:hypothetical protein
MGRDRAVVSVALDRADCVNSQFLIQINLSATRPGRFSLQSATLLTREGNFMSRSMLLVSTAILSLGIMGVSAWADNCTGYDALVSQSAETIDLGKGVKQTSIRSQSVLFSNDSMYNLVAGECAGTMLQTEDGKVQQTGYCSRRDEDGDTQSIAFQFSPGAEKGEWKSIGGTGKFAGKQGAGWVQPVLMDGKTLVVKWGGECH